MQRISEDLRSRRMIFLMLVEHYHENDNFSISCGDYRVERYSICLLIYLMSQATTGEMTPRRSSEIDNAT